jgi:multimeric flavodoxin WrbA
MRPILLVVHHSHGWRTTRMAEAVIAAAQATDAVEVVARRAADATLADLKSADGYLFGTPETFGSMSGMLKDFFERTYYPAQDLLRGRPYALFVCAGNDGSGAVASIQRIARGYGLREVQAALIVRSDAVESRLQECEELGTLMALGLSLGLF